jgi:hypothetical protein
MKRLFKVFLGSIVTLIIVLSLSVGYLTFGPIVFGPKSEVSKACQSITLGMGLTEATAMASQADMDLGTYDNTLQISKVSGDWICVCKANLEHNDSISPEVTAVNKVFCSD